MLPSQAMQMLHLFTSMPTRPVRPFLRSEQREDISRTLSEKAYLDRYLILLRPPRHWTEPDGSTQSWTTHDSHIRVVHLESEQLLVCSMIRSSTTLLPSATPIKRLAITRRSPASTIPAQTILSSKPDQTYMPSPAPSPTAASNTLIISATAPTPSSSSASLPSRSAPKESSG